MATDCGEIPGYGPTTSGDVQGAVVKSFLILFAAVAPPALLYTALSETDFATIRELAPWALMLLGFGGMAVALRARRGSPAAERDSLATPPTRPRWTRSSGSARGLEGRRAPR
jgi:hypothetical protein